MKTGLGLYMMLAIALALWAIGAVVIEAFEHKTKRVIIEELVTYNGFGVITNFEKGYGYYLGRTLDSQQVVFEDVVCKYGIGDTIIPMKILK